MTEQTSPNYDYTLGFSQEILDALMRRTADTNAAHLLPYLKPGMRILDVGCGPGNISVGLAQAVAPGELHGIDNEESQVNVARAIAARYQQENAIFHVSDAGSLPFEDGYFDAVHFHDVLMHIPATQLVLAESKRVLKPGGVISCREMICESCFTYPDFGILRRTWDMFEDVIATGDGHPQMGKDLKTQLHGAGFVDSRISASFEIYATPEEVAFIHQVAQEWFLAEEMQEQAISFGASTQDLNEDIQKEYSRWKDHPGAVCGLAFGVALAFKP